ncbi:MAG: fibronectin type III domain-containing protein, partial [Bacteroidales bacterium]|nr:fibronectin type III domain-containing protein [Bacteroidales bacterium]
MKKTTLRQAALRLVIVAIALLAPLGLRAQQTAPYNEGFEDMSSVTDLNTAGWEMVYQSHSGSFLAIETGASNVFAGSKALNIDSWDAGSSSDYVIVGLPLITNKAVNELQITFSYKVSTGNVYIGYLTDANDYSTFETLASFSSSSSYTTKTVELGAAPSNAARIAIKYSNWYRCYVDEVEVKALPTCIKPTGLAATLTPGNGTIATLNWTAGATETNWVLEYGTASDFSGATSVNVSGTPTANLTGLTAEQTYYARVKADCGGGDYSDWSSETGISFTPTNDFSLTVNDGTATNEYVPFYGYYADAIQQNQMIIPAADLAAMTGGEITQMVFYIDHYSLTSSIGNWIVSLGETSATTLNGLDNTTTLTEVYSGAMTFDNASAPTIMTVTFTDGYVYTGGNLLVQFNHPVTAGYSHYYFTGVTATGASYCYGSQRDFLPKITFSFTPGSTSCPMPIGLTATSITAHEAQLSWTAGGTESHWQICLDGDESNLITANTNPFTLQNLAQGHDYTAKVRAYCNTSDQSFWSNVVNFTTDIACPDPTALDVTDITDDGATLGWTSTASNFNVRYRTAEVPNPLFFDDFENGLSQWTIIRNDEGTEYTDWRQFDGNFSSNPITPHSGTYMVMSRSWSSDAYNVDNWLITPQVTLDGTLRFWVIDDGQYHEHYDVYVSTTGNDIDDFGTTPFYEPGYASDTWTEITVDLSSFAGAQGYIALRLTDNNQDYLMVDDFAIYGDPTPAGAWTTTTASTNSLPVTGLDEQTTYDFEVQADCGGGEVSNWVASTFTTLPSCMPVSSLAIADATTTTIDLTWTDQNNGAATYVVTDGDDNAYTVTNLTTTGCTVTGLTANTAYTFKVKANCGGGFSSAEMVEGRTACDAITTVPYVESFENADNNYCWTLDGFSVMNNSTYSYEDDKFIVAQNSSTEPRYVVLPEMAGDISGLMLNFWWTNVNQGNDFGYLYIGYLTDVNNYTTFEQVGVIDMTSSINVYEQSADYAFTAAPAGSRMALKYVDGTDGGLILIDKVTVDNLAACMRPTDLAVTTPSAHGATFGWTSNGTETAWQLYISTSDVAPADDETDVIAADANPFTVTTGLNPETEYHVWVRANCGTDGFSIWVGPETFTTGIACPAPTNLAVDNITGHTADLTWEGTSDNYNIDYRTAAYMNGTEETFATNPTGWIKKQGALNTDGTATLSGTSSWSTGTSNNVFDRHVYMNLYSYSGSVNYWYITPSMTINSTDALSFDMAHTAYSGNNAAPHTGCTTHRFAVLISTDDMATWTILREWNNSGSAYVLDNVSPNGENSGAINLSAYAGQNAYIAFFGHAETSSYDNNFHFDNVTIGTPVAAGEWQHATSDVASKQLTGLEGETKYEVMVQGDCGSEGPSQWTASTFFITDIACPAPTTLVAGTPGPNEVELTWTKTGTETAWQLCLNGDESNLVEVAESDVTITGTVVYNLTGLTAETPYTVKVRANCGGIDGQSAWSNEVNFTTAADCPVPVLNDGDITTITGHTANVAWSGFSQNDSYKVWYRMKEHIDGISEDFSGTGFPPTDWTRYTGLVDDVIAGSATLTNNSNWGFVNSATGVFSSSHVKLNIYGNSRKDWLVTPEINLAANSALSFDLALTAWNSTDANTSTCDDDRFAVLIYANDAWTILREWNNSGSAYVYNDIATAGENVNIDLSSYSGTVKIAFYGESTTSGNGDNDMHIDNVIIGVNVPAGTWQHEDVNAPATSTTLTGLDPETPYEVYVTGHCATGDVTTNPSATQTFITDVACPAPTNLQFVDATTTTATISWTGTATAWTVAYKAASDAAFTEVNTNDNPYTIQGLSHSTNYTVKVKAVCGGSDGESEWSNVIQFATECDVITTFPVTYGFETTEGFPANASTPTTNQLGNCWRNEATVQNGNYSTRVWGTSTTFKHDGSQALVLPDKGNSTNFAKTMLVFPAMNFSSPNGYVVSFWIYRPGTSDNPEGFKVYASKTDTIDLTAVELGHYSRNYGIAYPQTESASGWYQYEITIPQSQITGTVYLIFEGQSYYGQATYVDDITIDVAPTCFKPTAAEANNVTTDGATITWTRDQRNADGETYEIRDNDGNAVNSVTYDQDNHTATLTGLTPDQDYTFYVTTACANSEIVDAVPVAVHTLPLCGAPSGLVMGTVTSSEATFTWTAGNGNTAWKVYVKKNSETEYPAAYTENDPTAATPTATVSGLEPSTAYDVKIVPTCDETIEYEAPNAFTTDCGAITVTATESYSENFNSYTNGISTGTTAPTAYNGNTHDKPNCWSFLNMNTGGTNTNYMPQAFLTSSNTYSATTASNDKALFMRAKKDTPIYAILPEFTNDLSDLVLTFSYRTTGAGSATVPYGHLEVGYMTNPTDETTFVQVFDGDPITSLTAACVSFTGAPADGYIAFKFVASSGASATTVQNAAIENVVVQLPTTVSKNIEANKWYVISSPVRNSGIDETVEGVSNLTNGTFDLYGYDEATSTWLNYQAHTADFILDRAAGYIYRRTTTADLGFTGVFSTGNVNKYLDASNTAADDLKGFNLIGNPYNHAVATSMDNFTLTPKGVWKANVSGNTIPVAEGFLVRTTSGTTYTFQDVAPTKGSTSNSAIALTVSNDEFEDVAYVRLNDGDGLPKIGHMVAEAPALSIPMNGRKYAIANVGSDCESFDLNFNAPAGQYTISASNVNEVSYMHLIDRLTAKDIDLMSQSYTFSATGSDANRFMVKLSPSAVEDAIGNFIYWNGNAWTVEGTGTLQVFDVLGRQIS